MKESDWIADGTPATEPVTTETPAPEPVPPPSADVPQPRDEAGRFVPRDAEPAAAAATEAAPPPPPPAGATPAEVQDYIEALRGTEPYQLPKDVRLPLKRHGQVEHVPLEEALAEAMMGRDYKLRNMELRTARAEFERERSQYAAEQARLKAREDWVAEQEENFKSILKDPAQAAAYEEHLRQYQENPIYRQNVDQALRARELEAQNQFYHERDEQAAVARGVELANEWITEVAERYPTVDVDRVREMYATALSSGRAGLDVTEVERIFRTEADHFSRNVSPLQVELANLRAQVEALTASQAAEKHNATTQHAVARAATPRVAAGGAPAPAQRPPVQRFGINELAERNAEWSKRRD